MGAGKRGGKGFIARVRSGAYPRQERAGPPKKHIAKGQHGHLICGDICAYLGLTKPTDRGADGIMEVEGMKVDKEDWKLTNHEDHNDDEDDNGSQTTNMRLAGRLGKTKDPSHAGRSAGRLENIEDPSHVGASTSSFGAVRFPSVASRRITVGPLVLASWRSASGLDYELRRSVGCGLEVMGRVRAAVWRRGSFRASYAVVERRGSLRAHYVNLSLTGLGANTGDAGHKGVDGMLCLLLIVTSRNDAVHFKACRARSAFKPGALAWYAKVVFR